MEQVFIEDKKDNSKIILYLNDKKFFGYKFNQNNEVEKIDKSVFDYFDIFLPSDDLELLGEENGYKILLDKKTNYKHYIKDDVFDYKMFFENNGEYEILFNDGKLSNSVKSDIKKFFNKNKDKIIRLRKKAYILSMVFFGMGWLTELNYLNDAYYNNIDDSSLSLSSYSTYFINTFKKYINIYLPNDSKLTIKPAFDGVDNLNSLDGSVSNEELNSNDDNLVFLKDSSLNEQLNSNDDNLILSNGLDLNEEASLSDVSEIEENVIVDSENVEEIITNYDIKYVLDLKRSINDENSEEVIDKLVSEVFPNFDYSIEDMYYLIDNSENLNEKEKWFLKNEDAFRTLLPYVNNDEYLKYTFLNKFDNIDIVYADYDGGYYNSDNLLHIGDYDENLNNQDVISHEYMHMFQFQGSEYGFLIESTAELMSYEFYNVSNSNVVLDGLKKEIPCLKILMEIIGPEPILKYVIGGDFSSIEENVKPYLSAEEYEKFLFALKMTTPVDSFDKARSDYENETIPDLYNILSTLHMNKYGFDIENDETIIDDSIYVLNCLRNSNGKYSLNRYYFNERYMYDSYIIDETEDNEEYFDIRFSTYFYFEPINQKFSNSKTR